ncbi:hypothetical protein HU200_010404 [Digitaria exilis]|uniref:Uncharacterized protein n=1 Tax=Digitaria exilis TaxID=1010633 RepID=A0A835FIB2_9POAL|nr:hypothetical protein HU200_010404 [Digitaria exilis]
MVELAVLPLSVRVRASNQQAQVWLCHPDGCGWVQPDAPVVGAAHEVTGRCDGLDGLTEHLEHVRDEAARDCVGMLGDAEDLLRQAVDAMARLVEQEGQAAGAAAASSDRDVRCSRWTACS